MVSRPAELGLNVSFTLYNDAAGHVPGVMGGLNHIVLCDPGSNVQSLWGSATVQELLFN